MPRKTLLMLIVAALPVVAQAAEGHGGHGMEGHTMMPGGHDMAAMEKHASASMTGKPGDPAKVTRTIEVSLDDTMRFTPDTLSVKAGETIRFFVRNTGRMPHEMVIGSLDDLKAHADMMRAMPDMAHASPNMVSLKPGQRGGLVWQFDQPGSVDFACLVPGHLEAGMTGKVRVE